MNKILNNVINESIIDLNIEAIDKDDAIKQMASMLYQNNYITNVDGFIDDVNQRESMGLTGMGNGVAIPHGESDYVNKIGIAIGRLTKKIDWESLDEQPITLIFLFCVNKEKYQSEHLKMLTEIAKKLADDELLEKLKSVSCKKEFVNKLLEG